MGMFTKSQPKPAALPEFIPEPAPAPDHAQEEDASAALNDAHRDLAAELEKLRAKHAEELQEEKARASAMLATIKSKAEQDKAAAEAAAATELRAVEERATAAEAEAAARMAEAGRAVARALTAAKSPKASASSSSLPPLPAEGDTSSDKWSLLSWASGAGVHRAVASALLAPLVASGLGTDDDTDAALALLKSLTDRSALSALLRANSDAMLEAVIDLVWREVRNQLAHCLPIPLGAILGDTLDSILRAAAPTGTHHCHPCSRCVDPSAAAKSPEGAHRRAHLPASVHSLRSASSEPHAHNSSNP